MGFGQLLNVIRAMHQWVMIKLLVPDLHHMQDDLGILGVVFRLTRPHWGHGPCDYPNCC
jgi:hypothetical protein